MNVNSLAKALSGNLTCNAVEETAVDKLTALALGSIGPSRESHLNSLGVSVIAFKHAHRADYYLRAVRQLGDVLAWRGVRNRGSVAKQAITEYVVDMCPACLGAKELADSAGLVKPCLGCGGTGRRRYSDDDRKQIPGKAMQEAHGLISLAVRVAVRGAIKRLA